MSFVMISFFQPVDFYVERPGHQGEELIEKLYTRVGWGYHTWQCLVLNLGSVLRNHIWWGSVDHIGCPELNRTQCRQGKCLYLNTIAMTTGTHLNVVIRMFSSVLSLIFGVRRGTGDLFI